MTEKSRRRLKIPAWLLPVILALLIVYLLSYAIVSPSEDVRLWFSDPFVISGEWTDLSTGEPLGTQRRMLRSGDTLRIGCQMPDSLPADSWLYLASNYMHITARVDGETVFENGTLPPQQIGAENGRIWAGFPLLQEYESKTMTLTIECTDIDYFFDPDTLIIGCHNDLNRRIIGESGELLVQSAVMLLFGVAMCVYSLSIRPYAIRFGFKCFLLLGLFFLDCAMWLLTDSFAFQFVTGNGSLRYMLAFFSFLIMPLLATEGYCVIAPHSGRMLRGYRTAYGLMLAAALIAYAAGWVHISRMLTPFFVAMMAGVALILGACVWERWRHRETYMKGSLLPFIALGSAIILNILDYYVRRPRDSSHIFRRGMLVYLLILSVTVLRRSMEQCREQRIIEHYNRMPCGMFYLMLDRDSHGHLQLNEATIYSFNPQCLHLLRYPDAKSLMSAMLTTLFPPDEMKRFRENVLRASVGAPVSARMQMSRGDGTTGYFDAAFELKRFGSDGTAVECVFLDVTETVRAESRLNVSEAICRMVIQNSNRIIQRYSIADRTAWTPREFSDRMGLPEKIENIPESVIAARTVAESSEEEFRAIYRDIDAGKPCGRDYEVERIAADGASVWMLTRYVLVRDEAGQPRSAILYMDDITAIKRREQALLHRAERDGLTGLYNRAAMEAHIREVLERPAEDRRALLILDLDSMKTINDTFGHAVGDEALTDMTNALCSHFRHTDRIGRIGGDEFLVFLDGCGSPAWLCGSLERLLGKMEGQYVGDGQRLPVRCSVGGAYQRPGDDFEALYRRADACLYRAKHAGKNTFELETESGNLIADASRGS